MARRLRCPRCGGAKYWILKEERRRCSVCRHTWKPGALPLRLTPRQWTQLVGWFVRGLSARHIAAETGLDRKRILRALTVVRAAMSKEIPPVFQGTVEVDETYVGGARRNQRIGQRQQRTGYGRATSKTPVFGILCRGGKVWAQVVPNLRANTLQPLISKRVQRGATVCSDTWRGYTGIASNGYVHRLVDHTHGEYARGGSHINGLEGFWGYLKRRLAAKGGIRKERQPLYLAEYVWRYNHRKLSHNQQVNCIMKMIRRNVP